MNTTEPDSHFDDLRALVLNCTLKRSPELSHTQGLIDISAAIMRTHGVAVDTVRLVDHDIARGVYPDMTRHGWETDEWPAILEQVMAADILVIGSPIWLGDKSVGLHAGDRAAADAAWLGEAGCRLAGRGPSYLDPGSGGPDNDFTSRNTTFMTWNLCTWPACSRTLAASPRTATSARHGMPASASTSSRPARRTGNKDPDAA